MLWTPGCSTGGCSIGLLDADSTFMSCLKLKMGTWLKKECHTASVQVVFLGLETLLPLMSLELLKFPKLSCLYFQLLAHMLEVSTWAAPWQHSTHTRLLRFDYTQHEGVRNGTQTLQWST